MVRPLFALSTRPAALATSVALHCAAVMAGGHALSDGVARGVEATAPMEFEIALADAPRFPAEASTTAIAGQRAAPAHVGHRHAYPVPLDHDAHPHDPSLVHIARGATPAAVSETISDVTAQPPQNRSSQTAAAEAPLHFVLGSADPTTKGGMAPGSPGSGLENTAANVPARGAFDAIVPESSVDSPARVLSSIPVVYPEGARAAAIEADVLLDLVVDSEGRVASARALGGHPLGFADAALRAVRGYRFTPARRAGRPVRVQMRWTVAFRLQ